MKFLRRCCDTKRECLTYVIILMWVGLGVLGTIYTTDFTQLAAYFVSLTGFTFKEKGKEKILLLFELSVALIL